MDDLTEFLPFLLEAFLPPAFNCALATIEPKA